jgi:hypothetical protein
LQSRYQTTLRQGAEAVKRQQRINHSISVERGTAEIAAQQLGCAHLIRSPAFPHRG